MENELVVEIGIFENLKCTLCGKFYKDFCNLRSHMKVQHSQHIVKSGRKKYKFEDPVQPLLHNNEEKFDNKFRSQVYLIRCNSLSGGPMPP